MSDTSRDSASPSPSESRPYVASRRRRANTDYGEALTTQLQFNGMYAIDVYRWKDDDLGPHEYILTHPRSSYDSEDRGFLALRSAAAQARLSYDRMTAKELELFPEMAKNRTSTTLFLYCRNKIVKIHGWFQLKVDFSARPMATRPPDWNNAWGSPQRNSTAI